MIKPDELAFSPEFFYENISKEGPEEIKLTGREYKIVDRNTNLDIVFKLKEHRWMCSNTNKLFTRAAVRKVNSSLYCPCCRREHTVKEPARGIKKFSGKIEFTFFRKTRIKGGVYGKTCVIWKSFVFKDGKVIPQYTGFVAGLNIMLPGLMPFSVRGVQNKEFKAVKGLKTFNNAVNGGNYWYRDHVYDYGSLYKKGSRGVLRYSCMDKIFDLLPQGSDIPLAYAGLFVKYPDAVEKAVKMGLGKYIIWCLERRKCTGLNLRGRTVDSIFRGKLTREEKHMLFEENYDCARLNDALRLRSILKGMSFSGAMDFSRGWHLDGSVINTIRFLKKQEISHKKLMNYIGKLDRSRNIHLYADYLKMAGSLGKDLSDIAVFMPSDVRAAHDRAMAQLEEIRLQRAAREEAREAERYKVYDEKYERLLPKIRKKYAYENETCMMLAPENREAFRDESTQQHNCVHSCYYPQASDRKCVILFARRKDEPDKSWITVRIVDNKVVEARGRYNNELMLDQKNFIEEYTRNVLEKIIAGKRKAA